MLIKRRIGLGLATLLMGTSAWAQQHPPTLTFCLENADNIPWIMMGAKPGYAQLLMLEVGKQMGIEFKLVPTPWKQCLADVKAGTVDGAISGSYSKERAEFADYPIKLDGEVDATRRLYRASYSFYRQKGAALQWDGKALQANGLIGAQQGFSVVAQLKDLGAKVEDNTTSADEVLKRVVSGKYQAGVVQNAEGDNSIAQDPALKGLERVEPVIVEKAYYTLFSKTFTAKHAPTARAVWNTILKVRNDPAFKAQAGALTKGSE
ncbi:substrate-binding periplasmic protein [Inhella gelatinilytica]|uniref:Transporter substrate-binding domain-containing protein n=1 Tax=Inhella gelatinilytica TaxID=2795030 RepID=A0A931IV63_9BURK|nr:transporter substrate-binding domain-containing protein [Inhella gelatinilytica]MBH9551263.1 transporter substrate-binding domain-containing protein [Inhella gelatinilytica]